MRQLFLYDRILETAIRGGLERDASVLLAYISEVLQIYASEEWFEEYSTALSRRYLNLGMTGEALALLQEKLARISKLQNDLRKRLLFEEIIDIGLAGDESFLPLLRQTIDAILILDDPGMKTEILTESAARFLRRGLLKDSQELLQLCLSQIGSLESPWDQAQIYSRIALVYQQMKNERRATEYANKASAEIDAMQVLMRSQEEAAKVGLTAENLLRLTTAETALRIAMTIEYPWTLAETLCRMAVLSKNDQLLDQAYATAAAISNNARRLSTLFQLDFIMAEAKRIKDVERNLPLREAELSTIPSLAVDSYTSRLARLYLAVGDSASAVKTASRIRDAYSKTGIIIAAARLQFEKGRTQDGLTLIDESFSLAATSGQMRDRILQEICAAYLSAESIEKAAAAAAGMADPYAFAAATADIIRYFLEKTPPATGEILRTLETALEKMSLSQGA
jgi:tetratricopeptide (TPR) repeat protein